MGGLTVVPEEPIGLYSPDTGTGVNLYRGTCFIARGTPFPKRLGPLRFLQYTVVDVNDDQDEGLITSLSRK